MDCNICVMTGDREFTGVKARGLWDTGTSVTVITPAIAAKLHMEPLGGYSMNGLGGVQQSWLTVGFLRFPNGAVWGPIHMAVHDLPNTDVLIGMDVISCGTFTIRRKPDGGTLFTFDMNV